MSTTIPTDLARLDRLPRWPWTNGLLANLGGSFFFAFFDIVVIGAALPVIITDFDISASAAAWAVTASLIGLVVGEFLGATLATRKGRVFTLRSALWVFSIGMLLSAWAPGLGWLIVARFIAGIGTGADIAVAVTYVSEICPARMRGKITGFTTVCGYVGIAIVPFLAAILLPEFTWGWRALFAFGALGAVVLVLTRRHMPPSPRFLADHGGEQELSALVDQAEERVRAKV
ncbi:MAG: MFS transporter, partial [Actinobacteria bacterium]|nr:MFS transporter [Actinomycetota bacterium]